MRLSLCGLLFVCVAGMARAENPPSAAREFIGRVGDRSLECFGDAIEESYPFGRSNKLHDEEMAKSGVAAVSTGWKVFNRHYIFEGDWYAVEWFYEATFVKSGAKQVECTLAFGKVKEGKLIEWDEYFDDLVGELQQAGKLPLYQPDETPFPWPAGATLKHPYRP